MKAILTIATIVTVAAILFWIQIRDRRALQTENALLQEKISQLAADNSDLSNRLATTTDNSRFSDDQQNELLRLRGEVSMLRQKNNQLNAQQKETQIPARSTTTGSAEPLSPQDQFELTRVHTMDGLKQIELAVKVYAGDYNEQFPTNFDQIKSELGGATNFNGIPLSAFEFVNVGAVNDSMPDVINFRTGQPLQDPRGGYVRIYGLADGSVQTVYGDTADSERFTEFERQHSPAPAQ